MKKDIGIHLRLTEQELKLLEKSAKKLKITRTNLIMLCVSHAMTFSFYDLKAIVNNEKVLKELKQHEK